MLVRPSKGGLAVQQLMLTGGMARRNFSSSMTAEKQKLVILGSGWGGFELLRKVNKRHYDVTLISPNTYFAFTPLLASTAVGTLEFRCALEPVRRYSNQVQNYQAWCNSIDFEGKKLVCMPSTSGFNHREERTKAGAGASTVTEQSYPGTKPFELTYDKLIIACGAYSQTFNIKGVKEFAHFLKDVKDARKIRSRILECFEQASQPTLTDSQRRNLLHFVIVGGGPTGVEFAAELHDLIASDLTRCYPVIAPMAKITLYDTAPNILGAFDSGLVEYAEKKFQREGIEIKTKRHVTETTLEVKEEGTVPFGLLVWSTGLAPNPLISSIKELRHDPKSHSLDVDDHFHTLWNDSGKANLDVFAIGDASLLASGKLPATAQVANQQAKHLAKILNASVTDRASPGPFEFKNAGIMTYIGDWKALLDRSQAASGPKPTEAGRLAWLLWRSAYWSQALSWRNKASLAFYWFLNWVFGRDVTRF